MQPVQIKDFLAALYEIPREELHRLAAFVSEHRYRVLIAALLTLVVAYFSNPPPPNVVYMATGSAGSSYQTLGEQFRAFFAKRGIDLRLVTTGGARDNVSHILDPDDRVEATLAQGGLIKRKDAGSVVNIGSLAYEPMWLFYRGEDFGGHLQKLADLAGRRLNIGPTESGTNAIATELLKLAGLEQSPNLLHLPHRDAIAALERGEIDAVFVIDGVDSENIQRLIRNPDLKLASFVRAAAYAQLVDYIERLVVPMGGLDLKRNFPEADTPIIATTTDVIVKRDLHPAIQMLLAQAAVEISERESFFARRGEFPSFKNASVQESKEAELFYKKGPSFLMEYLPFWVAEFIYRMFFYLLPAFIVAYPFLSGVASYHLSLGRRKINAIYWDLMLLERQMAWLQDDDGRKTLLARLDAIERASVDLQVPRALLGEYYLLRRTVEHVRATFPAVVGATDGGTETAASSRVADLSQ